MVLSIRTALLLAFLAIALVPTGWMAVSSYDKALDRQFSDVQDRHLLLATNLSQALSRYQSDIRAAVRSTANMLKMGADTRDIAEVLTALNIGDVSQLDSDTGAVIASATATPTDETMMFTPEQLDQFRAAATPDQVVFLPVMQATSGKNIIFALLQKGQNLFVACVETDYIVELAQSVAFGERGHSAIVDQTGQVLAHPRTDWVVERKNIAAVAPVQQMMQGNSGIMQFFAPAVNEDMVAGYASVADVGWGVMVPQPISELKTIAAAELTPIVMAFLFSTVIAILMSMLSVRYFAKPIERLSATMRATDLDAETAPLIKAQPGVPLSELQDIYKSYNHLIEMMHDGRTKLAEQAYLDTVTGIGNRTYFQSRAQKFVDTTSTTGRKGVFALFDLDDFKEINDTRGHEAGDTVLKYFAQNLQRAINDVYRERGEVPAQAPVLCRTGGDEFAAMFELPQGEAEASDVLQAVCAALPSMISFEDMQIECKFSAGAAVYPSNSTCHAELMRFADIALYRAKSSGKNQAKVYCASTSLGDQSEIRAQFAAALENDELVLEYQPKYCLTKHRFTSVEALLRWDHPSVGRVYPDDFIPAIENTRMMTRLGDWVMQRAIKEIKTMEAAGHTLNIAVNVGAEHFNSGEFVASAMRICRNASFSHNRLQIEITETVIDSSKEVYHRTVEAMRAAGFSIAIDDFGRGYANLARLASVPVDLIKLDKSLIWAAAEDERVRVIMENAIDMAHSLGSKIVVEGVETIDHVRMSTEIGADGLQGYYYTKGLPADQLIAWLDNEAANQPHRLQRLVKQSMVA